MIAQSDKDHFAIYLKHKFLGFIPWFKPMTQIGYDGTKKPIVLSSFEEAVKFIENITK